MRRQDNSNRCIFLTSDNRCYIHSNYGEEALPDVCKRYPRVELRHDNRYGSDYLLGSCQNCPHSLLTGDCQVYYYFEPSLATSARCLCICPRNITAGRIGQKPKLSLGGIDVGCFAIAGQYPFAALCFSAPQFGIPLLARRALSSQ